MVSETNSQKDLTVKVEIITPKTAARLLQMNAGNRRLRKRHVDELAESMSRGEWKLNGDAIRLGDDKLIDGQHRLSACVKSGVPFESIIVRGVQDDVFDTIDKGMKRQVADSLYVRGEVNTPMLAGAIVAILNIRDGFPGEPKRRTDIEVEKWLAENPNVRESIRYCCSSKIRPLKLISPSPLSALHFLFSEKDPELANMFFDHLGHGGIFPEKSPPNILRERLIQNATGVSKARIKTVMAWCVKAWNCVRKDKPMAILRHFQGEEFPEIY
jgi:hypothetical protein